MIPLKVQVLRTSKNSAGHFGRNIEDFCSAVPLFLRKKPNFLEKVFIPTNKEGEVVDYLDKKSLNNIDNEIQDFDFKNIDELDFTIQLYSNDNLSSDFTLLSYSDFNILYSF